MSLRDDFGDLVHNMYSSEGDDWEVAASHLLAFIQSGGERVEAANQFIASCREQVDSAISRQAPNDGFLPVSYLIELGSLGLFDPLSVADNYGTLGSLYLDAEDLEFAERALRQGLSIQEENNAPPELIAQSLAALGSVLMCAERFEEAEAITRKALSLKEKAAYSPSVAHTYGSLGSILAQQAKFHEAEVMTRRGLALLEEDNSDQLEIATAYGALSAIFREMERYKEAEEAGKKALQIEKANNAGPLMIAESHASLSIILMRLEKLNEALSHARTSLRLRRRSSLSRLSIADSHGILSAVLIRLDEIRAAEKHARLALKLRQEESAPLFLVARSKSGLGGVLTRCGKWEEAEQLVREALKLHEQIESSPLERSQNHISLGSILVETDRPQEALSEFRQAEKLAGTLELAPADVIQPELFIKCKYWIAKLSPEADALGLWSEACRGALRFVLRMNSVHDQLAAGRRLAFIFLHAAEWASRADHLDKAIEWMETSRGMTLTISLAKQLSGSESGKLVTTLEDEIRSLQIRIPKVEPQERSHLTSVLEVQNRHLSDALDRQFEEIQQVIQPASARLDRSALLPPGTVFLALDANEDGIKLLALSTSGDNFIDCPAHKADWWTVEKGWFGELLDQGLMTPSQKQADLDKIRDALFPPGIQEALQRSERLFLSLSGGLSSLPIEAMTLHGARLDTDRSIGRVSSLASIGMLRKSDGRGSVGQVLVTGLNDYGGPIGVTKGGLCQRESRGEPPNSLKWAEAEANSVGSMYDVQALVAASAQRQAVLKSLGGSRIFHASVHGEINDEDPLASCLRLRPIKGDRGKLTALDLIGVDLSSMDLAVLSACCSNGSDKYSVGEGPLGLTFAFLRAGVRTVVATIRPVNDKLACDMMVSLHDHLKEGLTVHEALFAAKSRARDGKFGPAGMDVRESSAFVIYGDPSLRFAVATK